MNWKSLLFISLLLVTLLFRIAQNGGINKDTENPELDSIASHFEISRNLLSERINLILPQPQAALLSGMLLGIKEELPPDFKKDLRETSTIHIVVVSGQNLTLVAAFFMFMAPYLGRRKTVVVSCLFATFYAVLSGLQIPVIRALIMFYLASIASIFGREKLTDWVLFITGFLMLIYNPDWLTSISFQLSFLATIGVIKLAPVLIERLKFLPDIIRENLGISIAAQLLTMPIIAANFHSVSLIGIVANTLVIWTVPFIMITGAFNLLISLFNLFLGQVFAFIPNIALTYFVNIVNFLGDFSFASIYIGKISSLLWVGYYLLVVSLYLVLNKNIKEVDSSKYLTKLG